MTARILVVDDVAANRKLLGVRLKGAYYTPLMATSGKEALELLAREPVDLVILDVVMPGIDGFEVCRRIKADARTHDLPVVLLTSLDDPQDRIRGAEAGADDFLTKPVADFPLFSRLRSLTRMKFASDDLRAKLGSLAPSGPVRARAAAPATILLVQESADRHGLERVLSREQAIVRAGSVEAALEAATGAELAIVDLTATSFDPLAICSCLRSTHATRHVPILALGPESEEAIIGQALELGADDYVPLPLDPVEMVTRVSTHLRRTRDAAALTAAVRRAAGMVNVDPLTELGNRRLLEARLAEFLGAARRGERPFSVLVVDLDHFKRVNDRFGHPVGDAVLREFARRLNASVRANDVACRFGGEEFVVLLDGIAGEAAEIAASRLLHAASSRPFEIDGQVLGVTVSIGLAEWQPTDGPQDVLSRADAALYAAKRGGRNRIEVARTDPIALTIREEARLTTSLDRCNPE